MTDTLISKIDRFIELDDMYRSLTDKRRKWHETILRKRDQSFNPTRNRYNKVDSPDYRYELNRVENARARFKREIKKELDEIYAKG